MQITSVLNLRFHLIDDNMQLPQICYFLQVVNHVCVLIKICIKHLGERDSQGGPKFMFNCYQIDFQLGPSKGGVQFV